MGKHARFLEADVKRAVSAAEKAGVRNYRVDIGVDGTISVFEVPIEKTARPISEVRKQAWETRRAKYGERGHNGAYDRPMTRIPRHGGGE